jgi:hypothetical protein
MNINYKQILTYWSSIAYHHEQIRSFGFGDIEECTNDIVTKQEPKYTRMYLVPEQVTLNQNHIHYNFAVIIMDKIEEDLSNLEEVMSDTLEIAKDVWTIFYQSYTASQGDFAEIIQGDWDPDVHPFTERFDTVVGGWTLHISMSAPFNYDTCVIPDTEVFPQDESYSSYYQIITDWRNFANEHRQINSFGFGDITELTMDITTKQEPKYPRLYFVPNRTRLQQSHMHITWTVIMCDKVEDDLSNIQDVLSDQLEIVKDFFARTYLSDYEADWDAAVEPFIERGDAVLGGWTLTISITQKSDYNRCVLPVLPFGEGITWEELDKLWKNVDQHWADVKRTN